MRASCREGEMQTGRRGAGMRPWVVWGQAVFDRTRRVGWVDLLVVAGLAGLLYGVVDVGHQWSRPMHRTVEIDLDDLWALPRYTFYSLSRGLVAYVLSLGFTLVYGYWAARDRVAERVLVPLLDILQSIPVLSFLPGLVLALIALFPSTNTGLELAAVIMIFTGQAWNMTFSFYHSLRAIPIDLREVASVYRYGWWQRFRWLELPYSTIGLVWNSMMSMAGGWFFLMVTETFQLGNRDFRLPGLGSYMSVAADQGRWGAQLWAILAMTLMIVGLDQLLWRPVVVWAQKYRVEDSAGGPVATSWFLNWLRRSRLLAAARHGLRRLRREATRVPAAAAVGEPAPRRRLPAGLDVVPLAALMLLLAYGIYRLALTVWEVPGG